MRTGILFETEIDAGDQGFLNKLRPVEHFNEVRQGGGEGKARRALHMTYCITLMLQLFQLSQDLDQSGRDSEPITGLHLEPRKLENNDLKYYIVVATPRWGNTVFCTP